jgi:hypothetical protein
MIGVPYLFVAGLLVGVLLSAPQSWAEDCDFRQREIIFAGKLCVRGNCNVVRHKIAVVKDKVLFYDRPDAASGSVFILGRTIDLLASEYSRSPSLPPPDISRIAAFGFAALDGTSLILRAQTQGYSSGDKLVQEEKKLISIKIAGCEICSVAYDIIITGTMLNGRPIQAPSSFKEYSCAIIVNRDR